MDELIKLYGYGYSIDVLAEDYDMTEEDVLGIIRKFKSDTMPNKMISKVIKDLMIERFKSGVPPTLIEKEMAIGKRSLVVILKKLGIYSTHTKGDKLDFVKINHNKFDCCPDCNSNNVNEISKDYLDDTYDGRANKNSFCMDCGTEWFVEGNEVRKVIFENIG